MHPDNPHTFLAMARAVPFGVLPAAGFLNGHTYSVQHLHEARGPLKKHEGPQEIGPRQSQSMQCCQCMAACCTVLLEGHTPGCRPHTWLLLLCSVLMGLCMP